MRIGIIGGGQLAKMTAQAASQLGCEVVILERTSDFPASSLAAECIVGDWNTPEPLLKLAGMADVVTLENEFVPADLLQTVEARGHKVWPSSRALSLVQDKLLQKQTLQKAGLATPLVEAVNSIEDLQGFADRNGLPFILKARFNGYDGKGNVTVRALSELQPAWKTLRGDSGNLLCAEEFCHFERELATIVTRGQDGATIAYPIVETVQKNHICHTVRAPAAIPQDLASRATQLAISAVTTVGGTGCFGVEMFLTGDGKLSINELAPRVHNSGHYTIEACDCSQFENHIRAVLGWPLGSTAMRVPAAVMVNLLGAGPGAGVPTGLNLALAVPGAHLHIYGKRQAAAGRKMGHITALASTAEQAFRTAQSAAASLVFGQPAEE